MTKNNLNLIVAIVFLLGFLYFWEKAVVSKYAPKPQPASTEKLSTKAQESAAISALADKMAPVTPQPKSQQDDITKLVAPNVEAWFESASGRVLSWKIKENDHWLEMVLPERHRSKAPLEIFADQSHRVTKTSDSEAVFETTLPNGVVAKKTVSLLTSPPFHSVKLEFINPTQNEINLNTDFIVASGIDKHKVNEPYNPKGSDVMPQLRATAFDAKIKHWRPGFIFGRTVDHEQSGNFEWIGVDNNHFMAALVGTTEKIPAIHVSADRKTAPVASARLQYTLKPSNRIVREFYFYMGPKKYEELKMVGHNLDKAVDFGFFGVISKALLFLLNKFEGMTNNYGWAIIILTFLIQIVVFPLTIKNFKHSARMKELQPQLKKIQEQFKSDPKRMQVETFNLYRKNGMKFMGMEGCFPVLLQIPLFFAFYSTLNVAFELRGAPWIFWIKDLAAHDPYYVLPIIMGAGMFLQQKMTSVAMDPAQARMMLFMPIMFTFMFLKLPAGLVLYWCVNSITNIVIQALMKRQAPTPTTA